MHQALEVPCPNPELKVTGTITSYFAPWNALATEVACMTDNNPTYTVGGSNIQLSKLICELMGWEGFDLLGEYDFKEAYDRGNIQHVQAHCCLAFLKFRLFQIAGEREVGDMIYNYVAVASNEYWYQLLSDKFRALVTNTSTTHDWIQ